MDGAGPIMVDMIAGLAIPTVTTGIPRPPLGKGIGWLGLYDGKGLLDIAPILGDHHVVPLLFSPRKLPRLHP